MRVRPKSDAWNGWFPGLGGAKTTPSRIFVKPRTFPAAARPTSQRGERGSFPVQTDPMVCKGGDEVQNKPMIIKQTNHLPLQLFFGPRYRVFFSSLGRNRKVDQG